MKKTKEEMYHKAHFSSSTYFNYSCPVTRLADGLVESSSFVHNRGLNSGSSSSSSSSSCNQNSNCSRSIEREGGIGLRRGTSKSRSRSRSAAWFPISVYDLVIIDDLCESNKETEDAEETESRAKSQEVHHELFVRRNRPQAFISIESACKYDPGLCGSAMYIDTLELEKEGEGEGMCGLLPVWVREESVSVSVVGSINIDDDDDDDNGTCEKRERDGGDKVCSSTVYVTWYRSDGINEQGNNRSTDITSSLLFFLSLY